MTWIQQLNIWLNSLVTDPRLLQWAFVGGLALLFFFISFLVGRAIQDRFDPVKGRIEAVAAGRADPGASGLNLGPEARGQRLLERLGRGMTPTGVQKRERATEKLAHAGYRRPEDLRLFFGLKILAGLGLPILTMAVLLIPGLMTLNKALPYILLALPIGLILPDYVLVKLIRKRQSAVRRGLPDVLDMLVVCSEAGMGLNAAIQRVALEMDIQHPILADELKTTMLHMGAGMDGRTALQELANRTGLDEMRSLAATLQQAMRFGTSISETLRAYSEEMRNKRLEAAQEQAAQVGVKMLIPIALFMLPAVMVIVMGTPMIKLMAGLTGK
jgi:tight adherence protein C